MVYCTCFAAYSFNTGVMKRKTCRSRLVILLQSSRPNNLDSSRLKIKAALVSIWIQKKWTQESRLFRTHINILQRFQLYEISVSPLPRMKKMHECRNIGAPQTSICVMYTDIYGYFPDFPLQKTVQFLVT